LAAHLDEGGGMVGAVDGDDEILARLAFRLGGWAFPHPIQPVGHGEDLQLALFQPAQVGRGMKDRGELVGIAFVETVEIILDHGFNGGTVVTHGWCSCLIKMNVARMSEATSGAGVAFVPGCRGVYHRARIRATRWLIRATMCCVTSKTRPWGRPACRTVYRPPRPGRCSSDG